MLVNEAVGADSAFCLDFGSGKDVFWWRIPFGILICSQVGLLERENHILAL